jgi:integrase
MSSRDDEYRQFLEFTRWKEQHGKSRDGRTIEALWDDWIKAPHQDALPITKTRSGMRRWLHVRFSDRGKDTSIAQMRVHECTTGTFLSWLAAIANSPGERVDRLSPGSVDQIRLAVQSMLSFWVREGVLSDNPLRFQLVPRTPGHDREREAWLTREQGLQIAAEMPPIGGAIVRHVYATGCRINNIRTLRKDQIDWREKDLLLIVKSKKKKQARIPVPTATIEEMHKLCNVAPGDYVYPSPLDPKGNPVSKTTIYNWFHRAADQVGIQLRKGDAFHLFRHGRAIDLLERTQDLTAVKHQLAHRDLKTTERYTRMRGKLLTMLREKIEE